MQANRRKGNRHALRVPVGYQPAAEERAVVTSSMDISEGGLCFLSDQEISPGTLVHLTLAIDDHYHQFDARIVYSFKEAIGQFRTGLYFHNPSDAFKAKLAQQILKIKQYRKERSRDLGYEVSEEQAAIDWVQQYAAEFNARFTGLERLILAKTSG